MISADIAEYAKGPARPSGGCGAVALLIGKGACIDLDITRSSYKAHEYDFYKPHLNSPFPEVDGKVSNACYLNAFDSCFESYYNKIGSKWRPVADDSNTINSPDYWVFHAPYNKLVRKTFGRVVYHDFLSRPKIYYTQYAEDKQTMEFLQKYEHIPCNETINDRVVIKGFEKLSASLYDQYVAASSFIPQSIGNCYTASIFMGLISLIVTAAEENGIGSLLGKTVQISGTMASLYSLRVLQSDTAKRALAKIVENNDIEARFEERTKFSCAKYEKIMDEKLKQFHGMDVIKELVPSGDVSIDQFYPNTYYLVKMNAKKKRFYAKFEEKEESTDIESLETLSCLSSSSMEEKQGIYGLKIESKLGTSKVQESVKMASADPVSL